MQDLEQGGPLCGDQIDHPHDRNGGADVLGILWLAFDAGPYVAFLDGEGVAVAVIEPHFAIDALTHHVVWHGVIFIYGSGLEDHINDLNALIAGEHCIAPVHHFPLTYVYHPDARSHLPALIRPVKLGHRWIARGQSCSSCCEAEHKSRSPINFIHGFLHV